MNPAFLLGIAFNIAYWHKKYHSGTICKDYKPKRKDSLNIRLYKIDLVVIIRPHHMNVWRILEDIVGWLRQDSG